MERRIPLFTILVSFCILMNSVDRIFADDVCTVFEFKCKNQKCILKNWLCDKADDCGDGSDEENCSGKIPERPRYLKAIPLNATSVFVSWMPPDVYKYAEPILYYELVYRETSSTDFYISTIRPFKSSISLHNLKPSSTYIFSIAAANNLGKSMRSDDVIVKLEKQVKDMISFGAKAVNSRSILASWNVTSQMNVVGYFLQVRQVTKNKSSNSAFKLTVPLPRHEKKYQVSNGIKPGTSYKVTLQPYMKYGFGQIAGPVFVRTPRESIQPPDFDVSLVEKGSRGVASLKIQPSDDAKALLVRVGKSLTKSFPLKDEKLRILPGDFKGGDISVEAFYWYFFALSKQTSDNRWSRERSIWLRGPINGFTAVPSSNSILLMWSSISSDDDDDDNYLVTFKTPDARKETRLIVKKNLKRGFTTLNIANLRPNTVYHVIIGSANSSCRVKSCRTEFVKTLKEANDEKRCGRPCSKTLAPICASDGKSYDNLCSMKKAACAQKRSLVFKHVGYCCYKSCPDVSSNVCGSDGITYQSECHLKQASCLLI